MPTIRQDIADLVEKLATQLSEHCDSVHIFVTFPQEDGTSDTAGYDTGTGNFYAQLGQINEWCKRQDHCLRLHMDKHKDE